MGYVLGKLLLACVAAGISYTAVTRFPTARVVLSAVLLTGVAAFGAAIYIATGGGWSGALAVLPNGALLVGVGAGWVAVWRKR